MRATLAANSSNCSSVNLAAANVLDVGLPAMVTELLDEHDLPGSALECEVSETTVMSDPQRVTEVLAALRALGEIVHDVDLRDGKFARAEVAGIEPLVSGIAMAHKEDAARLERGEALFGDLYAYLRRKEVP